MDSREKLAADFRAWLEWQQCCGTDVWKVEDFAAWDLSKLHTNTEKEGGARRSDSSLTSRNISAPKPAPKKEPTSSVKPMETPSKNKTEPLPSWWKSIYENRNDRESFDFSRIPKGGDGLQRAFAFRDKNCEPKKCKWGAGRFDAEVVLIEGHKKHLDQSGFTMLSNMREHVLRLSKNNLYWIPLKRSIGCGHCDSMALGQLNAIQPKAILVLGFDTLSLLKVRDRERAMAGEEFQIELNSFSVPAICTHHPMSLLEEPKNKVLAQKALITFRTILNRLRIR